MMGGAGSPGPGPMSQGPTPIEGQEPEKERSGWAPRPKVAAAATTVPFAGLVLWIAEYNGIEMPAYVAGAVAILLALIVAYLTPDR